MKHLLRKLHRGGSRDDPLDGTSASSSSSSSNFSEWFSSLVRHAGSKARLTRQQSDDIARASAARPSLPGPSSARGRLERSSSNLEQQQQQQQQHDGGTTTSSQALTKQPSSSSEYQSLEEEYQMQLAIALSVSNDGPEADIEVAKRISLGVPAAAAAAGRGGGTQAELVAYHYWANNVVNYDELIVDGFYDVYGVIYDPGVPEKMPSLVDLQGEPVSSSVSSEVVLVNRLLDPELAKLEQRASVLLAECRARGDSTAELARRIALLVVEQMGGPVASYTGMLALWRTSSWELRSALRSNVIPLGRLRVGLARHRALLFKVLADSAGLPCRLVKGKQYTGADEGAVNIVRDADNGEFIIDLMADPGALIPPPDVPASPAAPTGQSAKDKTLAPDHRHHSEPAELQEVLLTPGTTSERRLSSHMRSPSWTEGVGSRGVQRRSARAASQYVIDAAKENPGLAQKLHDVLLESGVVAPPGLLSELAPRQQQQQEQQQQQLNWSKEARAAATDDAVTRPMRGRDKSKPPLAVPRALHQAAAAAAAALADEKLQRLHSVEGLGDRRPLEAPPAAAAVASVSPAVSAATAALALNAVQDKFPADKIVHSPVAASAITAAVVASSMVVAAAKIESANSDIDLEVPISAAATATAAVVAATSAAVVLKSDSDSGKSDHNKGGGSVEGIKGNREDTASQSGSGGGRRTRGGSDYEAEESPGSTRSRTDSLLQDVAEYEIPWDELVVGDRIGLGSYGEVYRGEWRGTEVAIKRFLDQDISGDALEEFITEVRLMKRMRHPNVVLFMGAVTRPPHLSIVTEFLPRGSLYKLLHRPSSTNQLDERRRMRMALDVAKGMNYLHTSNPIIVHRDLKSPNLLVDKNWVVKVCDFGLSRMKNNTFLSSKSQAGTPEWMAPEVLRNEPSNEKADVYSFGVILWELMTLQQPWQGLNPMQVVGAVGFQHRRLEIPESMDANIAKVIQECWHSEPDLRPSFAEIMTSLRPLQQRSNSARQLSSPRVAEAV